MTFQQIVQRALEVRKKYSRFEKEKFGKEWSIQDLMSGFVGDVGDLSKLIQAKSGNRQIENVDQKLKHELSDCLWSILVLADKYSIDLEMVFNQNMDEIENTLNAKTKNN